jgi:hypothetical protein
MNTDNHFAAFAAINVNDKTEKKNGLTYLSWAWAVDQLMRCDPGASWVFGEPVRWNETVMVSCTVTAFGKAHDRAPAGDGPQKQGHPQP